MFTVKSTCVIESNQDYRRKVPTGQHEFGVYHKSIIVPRRLSVLLKSKFVESDEEFFESNPTQPRIGSNGSLESKWILCPTWDS